ncbi:forkhead-associated domain-containing protein 1-like [Amblyraja radiata]|uniref:forkhead-associated domain-containing protein 1-like n=1 Tax=Amblyraja radiata TaxID=386614 RepID=UPI0014032C9E|nr:forkhead-associated domain-containing protein 1-like [Amblyraja radiata]
MSGLSMKGFLRGSSGIHALKAKTTCIGRMEDSDLCFKNGGMEDRHALIELSDSENCFVLRDLNSVNGTFVNDCRIQNAAVRLAPGDALRFGFGGDTYELVLDNVPSVLCPPVSQRSAWPGHLQLIESRSPPLAAAPFPALSTLSSASALGGLVHGGGATVPHPPLRKRAVSAGSRRVVTAYSTDPGSSPLARGAWINTPGRSMGNGLPLNSAQSLELLLHDKEQQILKLQDASSRLSVFEGKCKYKEGIITDLRDEVASLKHRLTQTDHTQVGHEITQHLIALGHEIETKKQEIETLKEQIAKLQMGSSEVMRHSLTDRDLEIARLRGESEQLKKDNNIITGLVTSLQREVTSKEHQLLQANSEGEKLRRVIQEKHVQLAAMSAKFSRLRESSIHHEEMVDKEKELVAQRNNVKHLESRLAELETENAELHGQQERGGNSAAEDKRAQEQLEEELEKTRQQLQEMGRRERMVRVDLQQTQARLERFRSRILQVTFSAPGVHAPDQAVSDNQVMEQMQLIIEERADHKDKLQEATDRRAREEEERVNNKEGLRRALGESQARLQTDFGKCLEQEFATLRDLSVYPELLWVQEAATGILSSTLSWAQQVEQSLVDAGIDVSSCEGGVRGCVQLLHGRRLQAEEQVKALQEQVDRMQNSRDCDRREQLIALRAECKQQMEEEFQRWQSQVEEQHHQQLAEALSLEKEKGSEAVEEEKMRHQETERRLRELSENATVKQQEADTLRLQLITTSQSLEEAGKMEAGLREELAAQAQCQSAERQEVGNRIEVERQNQRHEVAEFKEQIRQHSRTIVALEGRLLTVSGQQQAAEEHRAILSGKLDDARKELEERERKWCMKQPVHASPPPAAVPAAPDLHAQERLCALLRKELAEGGVQLRAQQEVIVGLRKDLAASSAKMSDLAGELSEKQKVELEQSHELARSQVREVSTLRQQLARMSQLVDKKNEELQSQNAELRACTEKLEHQKAAKKEKDKQCKQLQQELSERDSQPHQGLVHTEVQEKLNSDLALVAAECKGHRHEEVIQRQREALSELRSRIKCLEQAHPPRTSQEEALQQLMRLKKELTDLPSHRMLGSSESAGSFLQSNADSKTEPRGDSFVISDACIERTSLFEMSEALDLSEQTYLDLVKALSSLLNVRQMSGSLSLKHVPRDEREKLAEARRRDAELLDGCIGGLKGQLARKDQLLGSYEKDLEQLRRSQVTLHQRQADVESLQERLQSLTEENCLIRESQERIQARCDQEKRLNKALKQRKGIHVEQLERKGSRSPSHSCVNEDTRGTAEARRRMTEERLRRKDYEIDVLKKELGKQGQDLCDTTTQLVNLQNSLRTKQRTFREE